MKYPFAFSLRPMCLSAFALNFFAFIFAISAKGSLASAESATAAAIRERAAETAPFQRM
jgi:hypothetical protein